jgi:hypothetical protein
MSRKVEASHKEYPYRSAFGAVHSTATPVPALSGTNDPFFAPVPESSLGWRSTRKSSTDETMQDSISHSTEHSQAYSDMAITWPRRDFQKHMDEAAVDEIVQALSPSRKSQLLSALSPGKSSSSGIQPPINTPTTAEASQQGSSAEQTPKDGLGGPAASNLRGLGHGVTTRAMKATGMMGRDRSSSGSSKRKRTLSPSPSLPRIEALYDPTPPAKSQYRGKAMLADDADSGSDVEINVKADSRKSSAQGVSLRA